MEDTRATYNDLAYLLLKIDSVVRGIHAVQELGEVVEDLFPVDGLASVAEDLIAQAREIAADLYHEQRRALMGKRKAA